MQAFETNIEIEEVANNMIETPTIEPMSSEAYVHDDSDLTEMNHESNETQEYFENLTELWEEKLNLLQLLQHFAVYTNQSQKSMTYLLRLLKAHEPAPLYSLLPNTGKELIAVDG